MELKDQDIKQLYKWMGKTSQSLIDINNRHNELITQIKEDRKERKEEIKEDRKDHKEEIKTLIAENKTNMDNCNENSSMFKHEKKYVYGLITLLIGMVSFIARKVFY